MFINRDGKSHLYKGDCFSLKQEIKEFSCNVGFVNPPYSDSVYSEISFVELMLDSLLPDSIGVAIVPVNAVSSRTKKHSNLTEVKKRILQKHTLLASIQMPNNLFYPKGTETVILVFKTYKTHNQPTWFAKFDDGYELLKHQKTRTPTAKADEKYQNFLNAYRNMSETDFSFVERVNYEEQWIYTILKTHDYHIESKDLQKVVNEYLSYLFNNNYF
jgi:type I restriction-modification system DNA methylase subunit